MKRYMSSYFVIIASYGAFGHARHHPMNLTIAKEKVEAYYEQGHYDADITKVIDKAIKHFSRVPVTLSATVIFDIDDTVLSTFTLDKSISYGFVPELSQAYERFGELPEIPQVKRLYDYLVGRGFHIIFLTGRKESARAGTIKNLNNQGFTTFDTLIARAPAEEKLTAQLYKTAHRTELAHEGYDIVGTVGDQWSDLCGPFSGYHVKLPNYRYILK